MTKEDLTDKLVEDIKNLLVGNIDPSQTGTINYLTYKIKAICLQYAEQLKE